MGDKQTAEFEFFCGVFRERYKMFSKVKRPLEIERDSSPKRAKSRKGLLTCGIGTGNRNLSICNKQTQIRIRVRIYENLRLTDTVKKVKYNFR